MFLPLLFYVFVLMLGILSSIFFFILCLFPSLSPACHKVIIFIITKLDHIDRFLYNLLSFMEKFVESSPDVQLIHIYVFFS